MPTYFLGSLHLVGCPEALGLESLPCLTQGGQPVYSGPAVSQVDLISGPAPLPHQQMSLWVIPPWGGASAQGSGLFRSSLLPAFALLVPSASLPFHALLGLSSPRRQDPALASPPEASPVPRLDEAGARIPALVYIP